MKEQPILTLAGLNYWARQKRSVVCPSQRCFAGPSPAAFVLNYSGAIILRMLTDGMYLYEKKEKGVK